MGKCFNTITVDAAPDTVWKAIRNFHDLGWGGPAVTSVDKVGAVPGDQKGAKRVINKAFHETLLSLDDRARTFSYSIDDGPEPVSKKSVRRYVGTVKVLAGPQPDSSQVEWTSEFQSSKDKQVEDFCNPIYGALLQGLRSRFAR